MDGVSYSTSPSRLNRSNGFTILFLFSLFLNSFSLANKEYSAIEEVEGSLLFFSKKLLISSKDSKRRSSSVLMTDFLSLESNKPKSSSLNISSKVLAILHSFSFSILNKQKSLSQSLLNWISGLNIWFFASFFYPSIYFRP